MGKRSRKRDRGPTRVVEPDDALDEDEGTGVAVRTRSAEASAGRRARTRAAAADAPVPRSPQRRPPREERPKAPWDPFPLVELCVLAGVVMIIVGLVGIEGSRGQALLLLGLVLAALGGLDTSVREHFAGYRSHTSILSGFPAVAVAGVLYFVKAPVFLVLGLAVAVFAVAFSLFRAAFQRRAGVAWR